MKRNQEQKIVNNRGFKGLMALVFAAMAYGFASLAIDSGSWLEYFLIFFFAVWAIKSALRSIRS